MNILESVNEMIYNHNISSVKKRHLYLAYLMLHIQNPGLHPDDHLSEGGGYMGSQVILCEEILTRNAGSVPDNFHYPCSFLKIVGTLEELESFHQDLVTDDPNDTDTEYLAMIHSLQYFMEEMKPSELNDAVDSLQKLYLYHACENDTNEEESEKPAGILKECADVLNWIQQFSN